MEKHWISESWDGFRPGRWNRTSVNVRDFIQNNYTPYEGDEAFLAGPTEATRKLWEQVMDLSKKEREAGGVLDMDTKIISSITSHGLQMLIFFTVRTGQHVKAQNLLAQLFLFAARHRKQSCQEPCDRSA